MINVCIIDDHDIVRHGIKKLLESTGSIQVVQEARSPSEIMNRSTSDKIQVIILDLSFDGYCDLSAIELMKNKIPLAEVLIFSMHDESVFGLQALKYKVKGYVNKQSNSNQLIEAVYKVADGNVFISPALSEALANEYMSPNHNRMDSLSVREKEVLILMGAGFTLKEISNKLFLSIKTISTYKRHILDKLKLHNAADIIKYCMHHKLV